MLERGSMDDDVDPFHRVGQAFDVADVAKNITKIGMVSRTKPLAHLELLGFVARIDHQLLGFVPVTDRAHEAGPQTAGSTRDEHGFTGQIDIRFGVKPRLEYRIHVWNVNHTIPLWSVRRTNRPGSNPRLQEGKR